MLQFKEALEMFSNNNEYLRNYTCLNIFEILLKFWHIYITVSTALLEVLNQSLEVIGKIQFWLP